MESRSEAKSSLCSRTQTHKQAEGGGVAPAHCERISSRLTACDFLLVSRSLVASPAAVGIREKGSKEWIYRPNPPVSSHPPSGHSFFGSFCRSAVTFPQRLEVCFSLHACGFKMDVSMYPQASISAPSYIYHGESLVVAMVTRPLLPYSSWFFLLLLLHQWKACEKLIKIAVVLVVLAYD